MEEYLITARSVTQAQRMAQLLERRGVRAVVGRAPMGLTGKGCGYVLRLPGTEPHGSGSAAAAGGGLCTRAGICSSGRWV